MNFNFFFYSFKRSKIYCLIQGFINNEKEVINKSVSFIMKDIKVCHFDNFDQINYSMLYILNIIFLSFSKN